MLTLVDVKGVFKERSRYFCEASMHTQLEASLVRIFATRGNIVGMGFLASERSILSCAHVITAALSIAEDTPDMPTTAISLDFPLIAPGSYLSARVSFWQPPQPDGGGGARSHDSRSLYDSDRCAGQGMSSPGATSSFPLPISRPLCISRAGCLGFLWP